MRRLSARGLTLIEILTAVAIVAILAASAAPSFISTFARVRLEGSVNALAIDLQYARSEALRRRTTATVSVLAGGHSYTVSYLDAGTNAQVELKTVTMPDDLTLSASGDIVFDGLRGISAAQTLGATSTHTSSQLRVQTNAIGRVQMCSPGGTFVGYPTC
ncbi:MAG: GspH/FimT family pseudopilin [Burkholderiales bacterium]|nr:GspH/FimT family pseudopilin [Burkholderiales bacterium]